MTTLGEFITSFNTKFYAATSVVNMGWEDEEICDFLNTAQLDVIAEVASQGVLDNLSNLIKEETPSSISSFISAEGTNVVDISDGAFDDYFYFLALRVYFTKGGNIHNAIADKVDIRDAKVFRKSYDNVTFFRRPKILLGESTSKKFVLILDSHTTEVNNIVVTYLKSPQMFKVDGELITDLNESLHNSIINKAVEIASRRALLTEKTNQ